MGRPRTFLTILSEDGTNHTLQHGHRPVSVLDREVAWWSLAPESRRPIRWLPSCRPCLRKERRGQQARCAVLVTMVGGGGVWSGVSCDRGAREEGVAHARAGVSCTGSGVVRATAAFGEEGVSRARAGVSRAVFGCGGSVCVGRRASAGCECGVGCYSPGACAFLPCSRLCGVIQKGPDSGIGAVRSCGGRGRNFGFARSRAFDRGISWRARLKAVGFMVWVGSGVARRHRARSRRLKLKPFGTLRGLYVG